MLAKQEPPSKVLPKLDDVAFLAEQEPPSKVPKLDDMDVAMPESHALRLERLREVLMARGFTTEQVDLAVERNSELVTYRYLPP
jgi:hypothetical protein